MMNICHMIISNLKKVLIGLRNLRRVWSNQLKDSVIFGRENLPHSLHSLFICQAHYFSFAKPSL